LVLPVALTFAPDGRLFFVEVNKGQVRIAEGGLLRPEPFASVEVAQGSEQGMLGLALDPRFSENAYVYAFYSVPRPDGGAAFN
jgi:glucose/arabinose dehydrogenase